MAKPTLTVTVTDDDGKVILTETVDREVVGSNLLDAREGHYASMPDDEFHARAAIHIVGLEVCPWDCDSCRG